MLTKRLVSLITVITILFVGVGFLMWGYFSSQAMIDKQQGVIAEHEAAIAEQTY